MVIFFNFQTTLNHLHPLQVENCDSNSRLVVDEDDIGKCRPERVNPYPAKIIYKKFTNLKTFVSIPRPTTSRGVEITLLSLIDEPVRL